MNEIKFPVMDVKMINSEKVISNDYNPNKVATPEMNLLKHSIEEDGVTQPIVTFYDKENDTYIVIDGFHRYVVLTKMLKCDKIPIVVIDKELKDRMASTIRHNRARGKHQVQSMSDIVMSLSNMGWNNNQIAKHLGMEAEEILRLKQVSGVAEYYKDRNYSRSWEWVNVENEDIDKTLRDDNESEDTEDEI